MDEERTICSFRPICTVTSSGLADTCPALLWTAEVRTRLMRYPFSFRHFALNVSTVQYLSYVCAVIVDERFHLRHAVETCEAEGCENAGTVDSSK